MVLHKVTPISVLVLAALALPDCGPSGHVVMTSSTAGGGQSYQRQCELQASSQRSDLKEGAYEPAHLATDKGEALSEADLVARLASGQARRIALFAAGGLGKTRLSTSLRAQLCATVPTFFVTAAEVARASGPGNAVLEVIGRQARAELDKLSADPAARMLVMLDAIDEIDIDARPRVMDALLHVLDRFPAAQLLLLARPPILDADYGLGQIDLHLTLQSFSAAQADAYIAKAVPDADKRAVFQRFLQRHGLDAKECSASATGEICAYPYLSSYRDVTTLAEFCQQSVDPKSDNTSSRSRAHEVLAGARLKKELESLGWTAEHAFQLVDGLVAAQRTASETRDLRFDIEACSAAVRPAAGTAAVQPARVCERILQSALFQPARQGGGYQFSAQGIVDLFVARWLDRELGARKVLDCKVALKHTELLKSGDVFRYLVGQPSGLRCVSPLMDDRCGRAPKSDLIEPLDDGLPNGRARTAIVQRMHSEYEATYWKFCTRKTLKSLDGTLTWP